MNTLNHWRLQRISAVLVIPLLAWLVYQLALLPNFTSQALSVWLADPTQSILFFITISISLLHAKLGIEVIFEDYVHHEQTRNIYLFINKLIIIISWLLLSFALFSNLSF